MKAAQIDAGNELLDLALDNHGGLDRWKKLETVTATFTLGGTLFALKGHPDGLGSGAVKATVETSAPRVTFAPFAGFARGVFEPDRVVLTTENGTDKGLDDPRAACTDLKPGDLWSDLHLLYFSGYAMWNYLATPFMLTRPDFTLAEVEPWKEGSETWRRLRVGFPPDLPTHTPEQDFYFDDAGLLRRLDYAVDILGSPPPAAHYCDDHREFSGLMVPTRRRVYIRGEDGVADTDVTFVELDISAVSVA